MKSINKITSQLTQEKMTKSLGERMLEGCTNERKVKSRHVDLLERSIVNAGWDGTSILRMTVKGELLDGQHRLHALKNLGWPGVMVSIAVYKDEDVTPELRASFNKSAKQSVADTMKMCYGWDNSTRRTAICTALYRAFIHKNGMFKEDERTALNVDKAFCDEIADFVVRRCPHCKGFKAFSTEVVSAFVAMKIYRGPSRYHDITTLCYNSENRLNCDSLNCIIARINDYAHADKNHSGEIRARVYRICLAIEMFLNGKRTCKPIENFKEEDVSDFGCKLHAFISSKYNEVDF